MINNELTSKLKELVDEMCNAIDLAASKVGINDAGGAARMELAMFLMYLSSSDGQISWEEANFISKLCDLNVSPSQLGDFIRSNNIYSTEFENKVPVTFNLMITVDNMLYDMGKKDMSASEIMITTYRGVGEILIKVDDNVHDNEKKDYNIYIHMLEEYRDKNYKGARVVSGFTKNSGSVVAPSKGGVIAPKKG